MTRLALIPFAIACLIGCSQETGLSAGVPPVDGPVDTQEPEDEPPVTEDAPEDEPELEDEPPVVEDEPEDEPPVAEDEPEDEPPVIEDPTDDPPPVDDCDGTSDLVYVLERDEEAIYTFDPTTGGFHHVGDLGCTMWGTPASMSVGRDGHAYVRYSDNTLYRVDLATMACTETAYGTSFGSFGMGFATDSATTWRDQLYVANSDQLAVLDTTTWSLTPLGALPSQSELTGNDAGELWAFLPLESPATLVQLDKTDGSLVTEIALPVFPAVATIDTFAFATWGGDFYLFIRQYGLGNTTDVYRVDATGSFSTVALDTGMDVVGAGVSTCASH